MKPHVLSVVSTELFVGAPEAPYQVPRVEVEGGTVPLSVSASGAAARSTPGVERRGQVALRLGLSAVAAG
jgi:hypothetical protein